MIKYTPEQMDGFADEASAELSKMMAADDEPTATAIANWWGKWYLKAGHKRLGRILLKYKAQEES